MILTFLAFDLLYFVRFIWLEWAWWVPDPLEDPFEFLVVENLVFMLDGITLIFLLILHRQSFLKSSDSSMQQSPEAQQHVETARTFSMALISSPMHSHSEYSRNTGVTRRSMASSPLRVTSSSQMSINRQIGSTPPQSVL